MTDKDWHPLTLKVMRLTKPRPSTRLPVSCEPNDLPGGSLAEAGRQEGGAIEGLEEFGLSEMVMLPPAFGSIFLGETLSCYINVFNDHTQPTSEVFVKVRTAAWQQGEGGVGTHRSGSSKVARSAGRDA